MMGGENIMDGFREDTETVIQKEDNYYNNRCENAELYACTNLLVLVSNIDFGLSDFEESLQFCESL